MQQLSDDKSRIIEAYERALKRVTIDDSGNVFWAQRPKADFKNTQYYRAWHTKYEGRLVGYKNGTRSGPGFKFDGCNLSVARLVARKLWGKKVYDFYIGYKDGNNANLHPSNLCLLEWGDRMMKYKSSRNSTGYVGVTVRANKFVATRSLGGKRVYLGAFDTAAQAHEAYKVSL